MSGSARLSLIPIGYPTAGKGTGLGAAGLVQYLVDELVRAAVLRAGHRAHGPALELAQGPHRLEVERLQAGVLDLVLAADLARDELGVVHDLDLCRPQVARQLE